MATDQTVALLPPGARAIPPQLYFFVSSLGGASQGLVTVTLGYVLAHHGFSVAAVAGIVALRLLPETWRVIFGPLLDLSLNPRLWYILSGIGSALCTLLLVMVSLQPNHAALIGMLALALGIFSNCSIVAQAAAIGVTTQPEDRGHIAGWSQAGNLAGVGLGGGLGLWLAVHVGMGAAGVAIMAWCLICCLPMLIIRTPRAAAGERPLLALRVVGDAVVKLASTRSGMLTALAVVLPMGLGSFLALLSAVSGEWHASADLTASTTGVLAGLASIPGCLLAGALCHRYSAQIVLAGSGLVCALGELAMAIGPRTPVAFVLFTLLNNLLLGVAWAAVAAVIFVGLRGKSCGTIGGLLGSLCNVPVVIMTVILGQAQARYGATGMMMIEALLGIASACAYGIAAWLCRDQARSSTARILRAS